MTSLAGKYLALTLLLCAVPMGCVFAQDKAAESAQAASPVNFDKSLRNEGNWYFSWGYSRQQYAPSDIHISQPSLGNDFTLRQVAGSDFPANFSDTISSITSFDFTTPQENVRIGKFLNAEKTFAIEFSLDHSKYNVTQNQVATVNGTVTAGTQPNANGQLTLTDQDFYYALHNGLNHLMVNAVWLKHLDGPTDKPGELQLISRAGAGLLLPHADNVIFGNHNEVGPKNQNVCCTSSNDWWQVNGWTAGVEVGLRYRFYKSIYLELTSKLAYGALRGVPVYKGTADQTLWMSEQVLSTGFLF